MLERCRFTTDIGQSHNLLSVAVTSKFVEGSDVGGAWNSSSAACLPVTGCAKVYSQGALC